MAIFKCKMCGGALEIQNNETVAICQYCGTQQTLPKLGDEKRSQMYDRANHFRRNNEFDKAMGIYEQILNEDNTDAEAYWSLVLCRYGIEYVEDPSSHKRVPTVNRAQFTSIFDDDNYKSALTYADGYQKSIYEQEAKAINEIQKGILEISNNEEPFDVFICYKESDNNGRRTPDSVLATELYHELTRDGFKVFFARITLEDKLGSAYEPYIFAALNSSKVMVVLGTKPEYFNAVWVKNEWSRYLALIKNGAKKMLIPAYRDMDPYDLPEEFSHLQAQDMSKLGFMQDLIRGIKKIVDAQAPKATVVKETVVSSEPLSSNITALLKRGFMALEDSEWSKADDFFEQALNQNAELSEAYLGKLMAELHVKSQDKLKDCEEAFDNTSNYQKVMRFADDKLKAFLNDTTAFINNRNEQAALEEIYTRACSLMADNNLITDYLEAEKLFDKISGYKDSKERIELSRNKIEEVKIQLEKEKAEKKRQEEEEKIIAQKRQKQKNKTRLIAASSVSLLLVIAFLTTCVKFNPWHDIVSISANRNNTVGLKKDGTVVIVGNNEYGQCDVSGWKDIVSVSVGETHTVGLKKDGTVVAAGSNKDGRSEVSGWKDIVSISAGGFHTVGLKKDGTVVAAGYNTNGRCNVSKWNDITAISASAFHTVGLKKDGTVVAVGDNSCGQCDVSTWTDIIAVASGIWNTVGLKKDGTVVAVGANNNAQCDVSTWTDIIAVASGCDTIIGVKKDGTVLATGFNYYGQCSTSLWKNVTSVSAGVFHTVGLRKDGTVVTKGYNADGQCDVGLLKDLLGRFD